MANGDLEKERFVDVTFGGFLFCGDSLLWLSFPKKMLPSNNGHILEIVLFVAALTMLSFFVFGKFIQKNLGQNIWRHI